MLHCSHAHAAQCTRQLGNSYTSLSLQLAIAYTNALAGNPKILSHRSSQRLKDKHDKAYFIIKHPLQCGNICSPNGAKPASCKHEKILTPDCLVRVDWNPCGLNSAGNNNSLAPKPWMQGCQRVWLEEALVCKGLISVGCWMQLVSTKQCRRSPMCARGQLGLLYSLQHPPERVTLLALV